MRTKLVIVTLAGLAIASAVAATDPGRIFFTSVSGNGDLASWPDSLGLSGLAGADAVCQSRAAAAGLPEPSTFVAWLSDLNTDAYCRVHGLIGTKVGNCGQPTLPTSAGPWVRVDGVPFGHSIAAVVAPLGEVHAPVLLDELGNQLPEAVYFTETLASGVYAASASAGCTGWTSSAAAPVEVGCAGCTTDGWSSWGSSSCAGSLRLLCLQSGSGGPLPPHWSQGARAFVTSTNGTGNLAAWPGAGGASGLAAADAVCQARAAAAGLAAPASFTAWLSDSTANAVDRLTFGGPWVNMNGMPLASTTADLTDGLLAASLNVTAAGEFLGNQGAWTGTDDSGHWTGTDCSGWTRGSGVNGTSGSVYTVGSGWSGQSDTACGAWFHLYCLSQQVVDLFQDDFESAGTTAWSFALP